MAETITIPDLENGKVDIDTLADIVNLQEPTTETRLSGPVNTWFGVQASLTSASGLVYTTKAAMDAAPGTAPGQAARVTDDGENTGLYIWSGSAWVKTVDPITSARDATNPVFVPGERGGITSPAPRRGQAVVYDMMIHGARPDKDYALDLLQNQDPAYDPFGGGDGIIVMEYDAGTWDNPVQAIGRLNPVTIDRTTDKQVLHITSTSIPGLSVSLLINPKALPPAGTQIRMSQAVDSGYSWKISSTRYQYTDRSFVADLTSLNINRDNLYPFVPKKRNNVDPVTPSETTDAWMKAIVDVRVVNAGAGKLYTIEGAYSPARVDYPCAWIIAESDAENFDTEYTGSRIITYTDPMPAYPAGQGLQTVIIRSPRAAWADIEFYITLDTDSLPVSPLAGGTSGQTGYAYIISPDRYTLKQAGGSGASGGSGEVQIAGSGGNSITATFNRDSAYDFEVVMQPNGKNGLFNFRSTTAIARSDGARKQLMFTNSDMVPPFQVKSNESNVDTIPPDEAQSGYTGGNHGSDGSSGGTNTATMVAISHEIDGVPIDGTKSFKTGAKEHRVRWVNKVMAWNTKAIGRYVLDQMVTAVIRKGTVEIWQKVTALENITISVDNGLQSFATGFDNILFYNGANKTSRVAYESGLSSGPFTTTGAGCFAVSLKGNNASGQQLVWVDRGFGVGDGRNIGGSAGMFRTSGGKVYSAMVTGNRSVTLAAGESYEWHMGITWGGLEGFSNIDSAVTAYMSNDPVLMYAKLNAATGSIDAREGSVINGQVIGSSGYKTTEPAGAYQHQIKDIRGNGGIDEALTYTDIQIANVRNDFISQADGATLTAANQYTNDSVFNLKESISLIGSDLTGIIPIILGGKGLTLSEYIIGLPDIRLLKIEADVDDTEMFQRAADRGGMWNVPDGEYVIASVLLTKSISFQLGSEAKLIKRANSDPAGATLTATGVGLFDIKTHGIDVEFRGGGHYDGNEGTMLATAPKGVFLRVYASTYNYEKGNTRVSIKDMTFRNGSVGYIYTAGDKIERRYRQVVDLDNCLMYATRRGTGQGAVSGSQGYQPIFVQAMDYAEVNAHNLSMIWDKSIDDPTQYAATGIFGSFVGENDENGHMTAGGAIITCTGLTTAIGMGRSARSYDDTNWNNNATGVIDGYGSVDSITVENFYCINSRYTPIRAKGSISNFTVKAATLVGCFRGINVGPSSTGPCKAVVRISKVVAYGATAEPIIETVGSSSTDRIKSVVIEDCRAEGVMLNPVGYARNSFGSIRAGNIDSLEIRNPELLSSTLSGIVVNNTRNIFISNPKVSNTEFYGTHVYGDVEMCSIINPDISDTQNMGISFQPSSSGAKLTVMGGKQNNVQAYGVFVQGTNAEAVVTGMNISNVTGSTSRGFYCSSTSSLKLYDNKTGDGVTTPVWRVAGANIVEAGNSWNPTVKELSAVPTAGTYKAGDRVMISNPAPGTSWGYVCTVAGTPGTWKSMGTLAE